MVARKIFKFRNPPKLPYNLTTGVILLGLSKALIDL
jgi:hypothetical protein